MSTAAKKKEVLLSKKQRLLRELEELNGTIESVEEEEYKEQGELIIKNMDALLDLIPTHSDGSVDEGHDDPLCLRCVLMKAQMEDAWNYKDYGLKIELVDRNAPVYIGPTSINNEAVLKGITETTGDALEPKKPKRGRPPKLSENQKKAIELGLINSEGEPLKKKKETKKLDRVLEIDEKAVDLPEGWS